LRRNEKLLIGGLRPFAKFSFHPPAVDRTLADMKEVRVGRVRVRMLHTPGHTVDSCCYVTDVGGKRVLCSGDTVVGTQPRADLGRTIKGMLGWLDGHWSAPLSVYVASLRRLLRLKPDVMLTGHGISNDAATATGTMKAGIRKLRRIADDMELLIMFPLER
jgi:glyoxylase-like metal-dependent hydrolase (beta-lactamase superfamily II)